MYEKLKSKEHKISWAYRWSQRLHLLKRDQIEVTASPEECLQHLEKMNTKDRSTYFESDVINNYKGYEVIVRRIIRGPKGGEATFILCHLEGKEDTTIVSLEVSMGEMIFQNLIVGLLAIPLCLGWLVFNASMVSISSALVIMLFMSPLWPLLGFVLIGILLIYPAGSHERHKTLEYIVDYMFQIEEKLVSQYPIEDAVTHQSNHPAADSGSHADPDRAE